MRMVLVCSKIVLNNVCAVGIFSYSVNTYYYVAGTGNTEVSRLLSLHGASYRGSMSENTGLTLSLSCLVSVRTNHFFT